MITPSVSRPAIPPPLSNNQPPPYATAGEGVIETVEANMANRDDAITVSSASSSPRLANQDDAITVSSVSYSPRLGHTDMQSSASVGSTTDGTIDREESVGHAVEDEEPNTVYADRQVQITEEVRRYTILTDPCVYIAPPSDSNRWYVVIKGRRIGVFDHW